MSKNTLAETIAVVVDSKLEGIHTSLPGRVEKYDYKTQKAEIKPLVSKKYLNGESQELPVLVNVPIVFPRTKLSGVTFPINNGDGVLLVFSERALERWYSSGDIVEPGDSRKFDLSDAIAIPGCFSFAEPNLASNNDDFEVHHSGQRITIKKNGDIEVGTSLLQKLVNGLFKTLYNAHTHPDPVSGVTGTPVVPMDDSQLTSKVKAQ